MKKINRKLAVALVTVKSVISTASIAACTVPNTIANGQLADATKVMSNFTAVASCADTKAPAGSTNSVQINGGSGVLGAVAPLTTGQVLMGATGAAPKAGTLTAGAGITIANGPSSITISATGTGGSGSPAVRELGPYAPPNASSFTMIDGPSSLTPTVTNIANVGLVYSIAVTTNNGPVSGAYRAVPTSIPWTLTMRAKYSTPVGYWPQFGVWIKDSSGKMVGEVLEQTGFLVKRNNSNVSFNSNLYQVGFVDAPAWFRVSFDGTNISFFASWDGQNWLKTWTETKTAFLNGTLQYVGVGGISGISDNTLWLPGSTTGALITYWDINDDPAASRIVN